MRITLRIILRIAIAAVLALGVAAAVAQNRAKTPEGVPFMSGGISVSELRDMERERNHYSLWVTTAAKGSGAHLSDVRLKIIDSKQRVVLDTVLYGPWLMIDLPLGKYVVEGTFKDQTQKRTTEIHPGDHHQIVMYFDSPAEVSPEWESPFKGSPYSGK